MESVRFTPVSDGVRIAHRTLSGPTAVPDRPGEKPPLVLLAGQSLDHTMWGAVAEDLATAHEVIMIDNRGTGDSVLTERVTDTWTTATFAEDVIAVLDQLEIERAQVYGFSMGGRIAQVLAARHQHRVAALVLGATGPGGAWEAQRSPGAHRALMAAGTPAGHPAMIDLFFSPGWSAAHPDVPPTILPHLTPHAQRLHFAASRAHDAGDLLSRITAPTLVLHGAEDELTPPGSAEALAEHIAEAELVLIPGARHGYVHERRDLASPLVLDFLARHAT
ncbi:alpha/beta fold hydrolase [Propionibacteriaceae bacterium Y1685]